MTPRRSLLLAGGLALFVFIAACTSSEPDQNSGTGGESPATEGPAGSASEGPGSASESDPASRSFAGVDPAFEFPAGLDWLNTDQPLTFAQLQGKVVLLDFWTYGCINCIHIIPDLKRLEAEFPDELVVIGVHSAKFTTEGDTENIRRIILRYELEHPVVNDRDFQVWNQWRASAWPTTVVVDPAGNIVGMHRGEGVYPVVQPVIQSLVQEFDQKGLVDRTPLDFALEGQGLPNTLLSFPGKVHADPVRDRIYIADTNHHRVIVARLSDGEVLDAFGSGNAGFRDGPAGEAAFHFPQGLSLDPNGQTLYVADTTNHAVRAIDLAQGSVTTVAGTGFQSRYPPNPGIGTEAALSSPWDVELDGDVLYVAMAGSHQLWTIHLPTGLAEPFGGNALEGTKNGPRAQAHLAQPSGLALGDDGRLYFADSESSAIRWVEVDPAGGDIGLLAGSDRNLFDFGDVDGVGREARLQHPLGVSFDGGALYVADTYNSKIKVVDPATGQITTLFGGATGWRDGSDPLFYEPGGLDAAGGKLYVADTNNHAIRIIDLASGEATTLVLKGIERFPVGGTDEYRGTVLALPPIEAAPGPGTIVLDVALPSGYKVNEQAPSVMAWTAEGNVASFGSDADRAITGTKFPVEIPVTLNEGAGSITGDVTLIWCADNAESLCFIEQFRISAPVTVAQGGTTELRFPHRIELADVSG